MVAILLDILFFLGYCRGLIEVYVFMIKADLHVHSNFSDGSDDLKSLISNIINAKIDIFALTDHDTIRGVTEMVNFVPESIKFIPSIELTSKVDFVKCHLLGFNCDANCEELNALIEKGKVLRKHKLELRINYLKDVWNIELTKEELDWLYSRRSVVKTHLANVLVKRGLADNNLSAMRKYLDGCKTGNSRFDGYEAIRAIVASGGIPVWAHPLGGEGEVHSSEQEFLEKLTVMMNAGIKGLECYYSRYNQKEIEFLVDCANKNNLVITGGSDYHGTNKDIPLAKLNVDNVPIDADKLTILKKLNIL